MFRKSLIMFCMILLVSSAVMAQEQNAAQVSGAAEPAVEAIQEGVSDVSKSGNVSLDLREADIRNVFKILAFKSGVNIVASPEVTGIVTIQLKDVPWQQALDVIVQTYGYAYEKRGSIIIVTTVENLKQRREDAMILSEQEPLETKTFTLNFGKASEKIESIEKMKSDRGSINFDERTNTIIVTDASSKIQLISQVIEKLDSTTPQVLIEAKIVKTNFTDQEDLGMDWGTQVTAGGAARTTTWPFSNSSENSFLGDPFQGIDDENFTYGTLDFSQLSAVFEMLKTRTNTDIISSPKLITLDNQPAEIVVGTQYPIPSYTYNEEQARLQVSGWEYKDIGVIFNVTPSVNTAGFVTLEVEPQITAITGSVTVENTSLPQLSNESSKTKVMVKDGDTLVIAGLVKEQTTSLILKSKIQD